MMGFSACLLTCGVPEMGKHAAFRAGLGVFISMSALDAFLRGKEPGPSALVWGEGREGVLKKGVWDFAPR